MKIWIHICLFLSLFLFVSTHYLILSFGYVSIDSILFAIHSPASGYDKTYIYNYIKELFKTIPFFELLFYWLSKYEWIFSSTFLFISLLLFLGSILYFNKAFPFIPYILNKNKKTTIFEPTSKDCLYVDPSNVKIQGKEPHNLIYIYLESIENSFMDIKNGGAYDHNYLKELTALAKKNISFSNTNQLGGPLDTVGSTWTAASMVCQMGGIPLKSVIGNKMKNKKEFMPNAYMLGDILEKHHYLQEFFIGQDSSFAGTRNLFEKHGHFFVYDLSSIEADYEIPSESKCGWGIKDYLLLDIAKDRLLKLSAESKKQHRPFHFAFSTIDAHSPNGYTCIHCQKDYQDDYFNVLACQSKQIANFVDWLTKQDFYSNTTIVLVGDHPTMAYSHLKLLDKKYTRTTYNCFINSKVFTKNTKNRIFTRFDFYPTILASLGFHIESERLGLGTNLFSNQKTIAEIKGISYINEELNKNCDEFEEFIYGKEKTK